MPYAALALLVAIAPRAAAKPGKGMWQTAGAGDAAGWDAPRSNASGAPRLPFDVDPPAKRFALLRSDAWQPNTKYFGVAGQSLSNNRRQALTLAAIAASLLNRTLLVCDAPITELYDMEALLAVAPVQVTYRCAKYDPRNTGRPHCTPSPLCDQDQWRFALVPKPNCRSANCRTRLGGGNAVNVADLLRDFAHSGERVLWSLYWGVASYIFRTKTKAEAAAVSRAFRAVRYARRLHDDAARLAHAMPGLAKPFAFHAAHVRTGDRDPHPLVDCAGLFGGTYFAKQDICGKGKKDDKQGKCRAKGRDVSFADAAKLAVERGLVRRGDVFYVATADAKHPAVVQFRGVLSAAGVASYALGDLLSATGLSLPRTTPSCAGGGPGGSLRDQRPCLRANFDYVSSVDQLIVAAARGGVHVADFPSTWDELTVELQCEARDAAGDAPGASCAAANYFHAAPRPPAPPFSPVDNKRVFTAALDRYCGIF